jgi:hypothetical protein
MATRYNKAFWSDTGNRTLATAIEVALPLIVAVETIDQLDYVHAAWIVAGAAVVTVLKQLLNQARKGYLPDPDVE